MAEKYGTIPPRFTKAWWSYFWMYYKWHTIITVFVILCIVITAHQCATNPVYDLNVTYAGTAGMTEETENAVTEYIRQYTKDIDGNGEPSPFFQQLVISDNSQDAQYNYAMQTKLTLEFQNDCSFIFLLNKEMAEDMLNDNSSYAEAFMPVSDWADENVNEDRTISVKGKPVAVNLKDTQFAKEVSLADKDIFIAVCCCNKNDEKNKNAFENSKEIANKLIEK